MYNNGTCHSPEETWMQCGVEEGEHACHWYELALTTVETMVVTVVEETFGIICQGALGLGSWVLNLIVKVYDSRPRCRRHGDRLKENTQKWVDLFA